MALENTSLMQEVRAIMLEGPAPVHYYWKAEILANEEIIEPYKVLSIDIIRDYAGSYADAIFVEVAIGSGTFAHMVQPFKDNLQITLTRTPLTESTQDTDLSVDIEAQTMRATLNQDTSPVMEGNTIHSQSKEMGDLSDIEFVKFQLVDLALEQVRMQSVGGVFRDTTAADVLKYMMTDVSKKIEVDEEHEIEGVDMYEASNKEPQKHIILNHGMRFTDVPGYLQEKCNGIYNAGLGYYLQKKHWFVYPLFDMTRYEKSLKGLTLINVPKNRMAGADRTFRRTDNQIIALVTGAVRHNDDSEKLQLNDGNGTRFTDARKVMESFGETKDNRTVVLRATNNNEYIGAERKNKFNNVQQSRSKITSNNFSELSRMARLSIAHLQCTWENSDPGAITPGMPVKYMYTVGNEVIEVHGTVIGVHHYITPNNPGITGKRHITTSVILLAVDRDIELPDEDEEATA